MLIILITIIILIIFLYIISISTKKKLTKTNKEKYLKKIIEVENSESSKKIIIYDSIIWNILNNLWYKWTISEQLKKKPKEIKFYINEIWELHKIRNKIAHEIDNINEKFLKEKSNRYKEILLNILR